MMWVSCRSVAKLLTDNHYLGPIDRGVAWRDEYGCIIIGPPTSRRLPLHWIELIRWCLVRREKNDGSRQWAAFVRALRKMRPDISTVVSYSDPSQGHTGALYRACNWWWAPTWHRLRPPPSGNGAWSEGINETVKDRWVFALTADPQRQDILRRCEYSKAMAVGRIQRAWRCAVQAAPQWKNFATSCLAGHAKTYNTIVIPLNSTVNFPYGATNATVISVMQFGVGITSVEAVAGVTLHILSSPEISGQFGAGTLYQRALNEWVWCA